jgi:ferredoxin
MSGVLVDVFSLTKPTLSLVDAVDAMEGNGPSSGHPRHVGLIAAGRDAVALDSVMSAVIGVSPLKVPTTREAARRGMGEADLARITVEGEPLEAFLVEGFEVPSNWRFSLVPNALARLALRWFWVKPVVAPEKCVGCGDCARMCAAGAVRISAGRAVVSPEKCVSCICCIEACEAGAIEPRASRLARLVT